MMDNKLKTISQKIIAAICLLLFSANVFAVQQAASFKTAKRYNLMGQVTGVISPQENGVYPAIRNTYNSEGLLAKVERGFLTVWKSETISPDYWNYYGSGDFQLTQGIETYDYNTSGLLIATRKYNLDGEIVALTEYSYDANERKECVAVRMNPTQFTSNLDACTLGLEGIEGPDRITKFTYVTASLDLVVKEIRAYGTELEQVYRENKYDANYRVEGVADANGNYTKLEYNSQDLLAYQYFPSKTSVGSHNPNDYEYYEYDNNKNRTLLQKRDGKIIQYQHDKLNRVTKKDWPNTTSLDVYFDYDLRGLQTEARYASNTGIGVTSNYNGFGELTSEIDNSSGTSFTLGYSYDKHSNRETLTYPDNKTFTYHYDGLDRIEYIRDNYGINIVDTTYDMGGLPESVNRANGTSTAYQFDDLARLQGFTQNLSGSTNDVTFGYAFNPASQVTRLDISNLAYHHTPANVQDYYKVNGLNQYTEVGGLSYNYDDNANLTSDGNRTYVYDVENRLTQIKNSSGSVLATFKYNPMGRLSEYSASGTTRRFVYDGDALIAEYNTSGSMQQRYVHGIGADVPILSYNGSSTSSSNRQFLHANHQGSIIAHSNSTGGLAFSNNYDEYGVPDNSNQGLFGYTGQVYLKEVGLFHYKARVYYPQIGRFLQTDPIGYEDQMNLYAYVGSDPFNYNDPSGKIKLVEYQLTK
ncbi:RHS repeat domain-containing protein [Catenovulum sediminis]|uniref:RHS repeat domain-containing protein n=1 Tax=Catenovulum sediminis TaxID=1740262 RepID=UPI00163DBE50|nr:RHS repeat-associated core domain-containing protein [Catenovulum sediminis]